MKKLVSFARKLEGILPKNRTAIKCKNCGMVYTLPNCKVDKGYASFCSIECGDEYRAARVSLRKRKCKTCGKIFIARNSQLMAGKGQYCSLQCCAQKGENNVFYRGGATANHKAQDLAWQAIKKNKIKRKPCEVCGVAGADGRGTSIVHAHHDDYNKPFVIRWLCQKHHVEWHVDNVATVAKIEFRTVSCVMVNGKMFNTRNEVAAFLGCGLTEIRKMLGSSRQGEVPVSPLCYSFKFLKGVPL